MPSELAGFSRRDLLSLIGAVSGSAAMYHAMTSLGFAADSGYKGPLRLDGDPRGASVLILGAGLAGMTAALGLRNAGAAGAPQGRLQRPDPGIQRQAGRPQLDSARRGFLYRTRWRQTDLRIRR